VDYSQHIIAKTNLDGRYLIDTNKLTPNGEKSIVKLASEETIIFCLNWLGQLTSKGD